MHCPTRHALRTTNSAVVDGGKRVDRDNERGDTVSSAKSTPTACLYFFSTISAANERMKFWTKKHRLSGLFRLRRSMAKDIESTIKEINYVAGELTVGTTPLSQPVLRPNFIAAVQTDSRRRETNNRMDSAIWKFLSHCRSSLSHRSPSYAPPYPQVPCSLYFWSSI